jgi:hypothetical protein
MKHFLQLSTVEVRDLIHETGIVLEVTTHFHYRLKELTKTFSVRGAPCPGDYWPYTVCTVQWNRRESTVSTAQLDRWRDVIRHNVKRRFVLLRCTAGQSRV